MPLGIEPRLCGDCGAEPGESHEPGCDTERCPRCGFQMISCDCIYEVNGMDPGRLEEEHPDVYADGPTEEMRGRWTAEWDRHRKPWPGVWPGVEECREYGMYARMDPPRVGWYACAPDEPDACESLAELMMAGRWDVERQRFVVPEAYLERRKLGMPV